MIDEQTGKVTCDNCQRYLGTFNGREVRVADVLSTSGGKICLICSKCGTEVYVCPNKSEIALTIDKKF